MMLVTVLPAWSAMSAATARRLGMSHVQKVQTENRAFGSTTSMGSLYAELVDEIDPSGNGGEYQYEHNSNKNPLPDVQQAV